MREIEDQFIVIVNIKAVGDNTVYKSCAVKLPSYNLPYHVPFLFSFYIPSSVFSAHFKKV